jgi:hypothetical protein
LVLINSSGPKSSSVIYEFNTEPDSNIVDVILVIAETRRLRLPVWKESILPILAYEFDEETQKEVRHAIEGGHIKPFVETTRVRLEDDHEGGELTYKLKRV